MSWAYLSFSPSFQVFQYPKASLSREKVLPMHQTSVDGVEDMSMLGDLHEAAILLNLHQRYQQGNIYVSAHPFWPNGFCLASGLPLCMWSGNWCCPLRIGIGEGFLPCQLHHPYEILLLPEGPLCLYGRIFKTWMFTSKLWGNCAALYPPCTSMFDELSVTFPRLPIMAVPWFIRPSRLESAAYAGCCWVSFLIQTDKTTA